MPVATTTNLSDLFFLGDTTIDGKYYGPVPDKFLTFTNNGAQTVYPFFRNPNTGQPTRFGLVLGSHGPSRS